MDRIIGKHSQIALLERRSTTRPKLTWADRTFIAALLAVIPRTRHAGLHLPVAPPTILRWNRDPLRRRGADSADPIHATDGEAVTVLSLLQAGAERVQAREREHLREPPQERARREEDARRGRKRRLDTLADGYRSGGSLPSTLWTRNAQYEEGWLKMTATLLILPSRIAR